MKVYSQPMTKVLSVVTGSVCEIPILPASTETPPTTEDAPLF